MTFRFNIFKSFQYWPFLSFFLPNCVILIELVPVKCVFFSGFNACLEQIIWYPDNPVTVRLIFLGSFPTLAHAHFTRSLFSCNRHGRLALDTYMRCFIKYLPYPSICDLDFLVEMDMYIDTDQQTNIEKEIHMNI